LRRAHGAEAGLLAARASYIAGFGGTATLAAGLQFGIPVYGPMAHSFIQLSKYMTTKSSPSSISPIRTHRASSC
ncbi:MAG: hypothetical protein J2P48_19155, partial [Alphaproteobacteria bacterium]|nr:hypothetical protein [Alphaproteobacteria bacterium]